MASEEKYGGAAERSGRENATAAQSSRPFPAHVTPPFAVELQYQGPLPPPSLLEGYERHAPGATLRLLAAWDEERHHRQRIETLDADTRRFQIRWGLVSGSLISLLAVSGSIFLAYEGREGAAIHLVGWSMAAIIATLAVPRAMALLTRLAGKSRSKGDTSSP